jgi:hypothetical protein
MIWRKGLMKKYLSGSWAVLKNYLFAMFFFYIFYVGLYKIAFIYSIAVFLIMAILMYFELVHYVGFDKRKYASIRPYEGAIYGLIAILPIIIIQIIISQLNLNTSPLDFETLKGNIIKGFVAPMLFIARMFGYNHIWSYAIAWSSIVIIAFLGYFSGYKNFDLGAFIRKLFGIQPRKVSTKKNRR